MAWATLFIQQICIGYVWLQGILRPIFIGYNVGTCNGQDLCLHNISIYKQETKTVRNATVQWGSKTQVNSRAAHANSWEQGGAKLWGDG
jgi:hypothetical protein